MSVYYEKKSKVGKKGEIYTDKEIRKIVGLNPDDEIFIIVKPGTIIIKKCNGNMVFRIVPCQ